MANVRHDMAYMEDVSDLRSQNCIHIQAIRDLYGPGLAGILSSARNNDSTPDLYGDCERGKSADFVKDLDFEWTHKHRRFFAVRPFAQTNNWAVTCSHGDYFKCFNHVRYRCRRNCAHHRALQSFILYSLPDLDLRTSLKANDKYHRWFNDQGQLVAPSVSSKSFVDDYVPPNHEGPDPFDSVRVAMCAKGDHFLRLYLDENKTQPELSDSSCQTGKPAQQAYLFLEQRMMFVSIVPGYDGVGDFIINMNNKYLFTHEMLMGYLNGRIAGVAASYSAAWKTFIEKCRISMGYTTSNVAHLKELLDIRKAYQAAVVSYMILTRPKYEEVVACCDGEDGIHIDATPLDMQSSKCLFVHDVPELNQASACKPDQVKFLPGAKRGSTMYQCKPLLLRLAGRAAMYSMKQKKKA